jgi:hypothetical protein
VADALGAALAAVQAVPGEDHGALESGTRVLCDLALQRWRVRTRAGQVEVSPPEELQADPLAEKDRIRRQERLKRDEQLEEPAVRTFIQEMERQRLHQSRFVSMFSLMRDGRELAGALDGARTLSGQERTEALRRVIDPYLSFVTDGARCDFTGFRLQDIWRYFRHTWVTQYTSTPGRSMAVLVRDRASPMHPVIGIAAISSPIVQIKQRDSWIGWESTSLCSRIAETPTPELGEWLRSVVTTSLEEIHTEDFLADELITIAELRRPAADTLVRLHAFALEQRRLHHRYVHSREHKSSFKTRQEQASGNPWVTRAETHLFRSKRALALADMLHARLVIDQHLSAAPASAEVAALVADREGRRAVARILRKAKADRVGIAMADITVCGAIPPYNPVLGGKLVAMLSAGPEVVQAYQARYKDAESEIASSIAGRSIIRPAHLVFLGTSSLYGVGSSQYNRVQIPATRLGGGDGEEIRYLELGKSESFGTSQFSSATVEALAQLVHQTRHGQRVNSIFGEGVSPKLRKIRAGLDTLGFPSHRLLRHGRHRIVYGIPLARNTREVLLGINEAPDYLFSYWGSQATAAICDWWRERWLAKRIEQEDVIRAVAMHTLVRPVRHGARVQLPDNGAQELAFVDELA